MGASSLFLYVGVVLLFAAIFTVQLSLVRADTNIIRELRERRPRPYLSAPLANQHPGMRKPAPPAPVEESPPAGPPPPNPVSK